MIETPEHEPESHMFGRFAADIGVHVPAVHLDQVGEMVHALWRSGRRLGPALGDDNIGPLTVVTDFLDGGGDDAQSNLAP